MASDFPASIDAFPDPLANSPLDAPSHSGLHQDVNDAVEKIEVKLGVGVSPASGSVAGQVLKSSGSGNTVWSDINAGNIKTEGAPAGAVLVSDGVGSGLFSNTMGLQLVSTTTIGTGVFAVPVNNCFSATFDSYKILIQINHSNASNQVVMQLNNNVGANYFITGVFFSWGSTTVSGYAPFAESAWRISANDLAGTPTSLLINLMNPFLMRRKHGASSSLSANGTSTFNIMNNSTASNTGFTISKAGATMTGGTIRVYGYRN